MRFKSPLCLGTENARPKFGGRFRDKIHSRMLLGLPGWGPATLTGMRNFGKFQKSTSMWLRRCLLIFGGRLDLVEFLGVLCVDLWAGSTRRFGRFSLTVPEITYELRQFSIKLSGDSEQILGGIIPLEFCRLDFVDF